MSTCIVGKFESFHRGHQLLIKKAKLYKDEIKLISIWLPIKDVGYNPLFTIKEREELAKSFGTELITVEFEKVKDWSPEKFLQFLNKMGCKRIIAGEDWRFGKGKAGNIELAKTVAKSLGMEVIPVKPITIDGQKIGTSIIRKFLEEGNVKAANMLLGFNYFCTGSVEKGRGIGRKIGFPTINVKCTKALPIKNGVYKVRIKTSKFEDLAIANYGIRPTFKGERCKVLEVHIPGKQVECFSCGEIRVEFLNFIRPEKTFESVEALKKQIEKDIKSLQ